MINPKSRRRRDEIAKVTWKEESEARRGYSIKGVDLFFQHLLFEVCYASLAWKIES